MGGGKLVPEKVQKTVKILTYLIVALFGFIILLILLTLLLRVAGITNWPDQVSIKHFMGLMSLCVIMMCAVLWITNIVDIIKLPQKVQNNLWKGVILALITAALTMLR